jgi:hypothetical protein
VAVILSTYGSAVTLWAGQGRAPQLLLHNASTSALIATVDVGGSFTSVPSDFSVRFDGINASHATIVVLHCQKLTPALMVRPLVVTSPGVECVCLESGPWKLPTQRCQRIGSWSRLWSLQPRDSQSKASKSTAFCNRLNLGLHCRLVCHSQRRRRGSRVHSTRYAALNGYSAWTVAVGAVPVDDVISQYANVAVLESLRGKHSDSVGHVCFAPIRDCPCTVLPAVVWFMAGGCADLC